MAKWDLDLINAKYHLSVSKRMINSFYDYSEKRFLIGVINELSRASASLIKAYLVFEDSLKVKWEKNLNFFVKKVGPKYLDRKIVENILKILEIQVAWKNSKVDFARKDKIILLVEGKYKVLTSSRLKEFINSVEEGVYSFPSNIKR